VGSRGGCGLREPPPISAAGGSVRGEALMLAPCGTAEPWVAPVVLLGVAAFCLGCVRVTAASLRDAPWRAVPVFPRRAQTPTPGVKRWTARWSCLGTPGSGTTSPSSMANCSGS
jgi:hypothetical protein